MTLKSALILLMNWPNFWWHGHDLEIVVLKQLFNNMCKNDNLNIILTTTDGNSKLDF